MKMSKEMKRQFVSKLTKAFEREVTQESFNRIRLFLDSFNTSEKIVPYNIFAQENKGGYDRNFVYLLDHTIGGRVFNYWMEDSMRSISNDKNKARKLVRVAKEKVDTNEGILAYDMGVDEAAFLSSMVAFFVDAEELVKPRSSYYIGSTVQEKRDFFKTLEKFQEYMASLLYLDTLHRPEDIHNILEIMVHEGTDTVLSSVMTVAHWQVCEGETGRLSLSEMVAETEPSYNFVEEPTEVKTEKVHQNV